MADAYLNMAERILLGARRPLRPREIVELAYLNELSPGHLHGPRQDKTLHARLSEDVARNPEESVFYRTSPGVFFFKSFRNDPTISDAYKGEYLAPPRRKELNRESILTVSLELSRSDLGPPRLVELGRLKDMLAGGEYHYEYYSDIYNKPELSVVHSFVLVIKGDCILSFRCGKFYPSTDPLYGTRSIGVGGAVLADDVDMLYESMVGIIANGINELGYGIGLPRRLAERARYSNELRPYGLVVVNGSAEHPSIAHVVMTYRCPEEFSPTKAALSVNDLRWVEFEKPGNTLDDYDQTSRFLFAEGLLRNIVRSGQT